MRPTPRSVGRARSLLSEQARAWKVPDDVADTAVLLLSELMTNAVRHGRVPAGRGLALVELLADAWGSCPRPYGIGKTVWIELVLPRVTYPASPSCSSHE
ncbi:hypothetical protein OG302_16660 [Streptomyces sp. NBC_01283]|uniref:ATP-binding protein n=1 Tax=Streptomyces sp. NBC_01283 TaxID=2903812 RepID=UPI00352E7E8C|nr:hypothetical protein OG302_16660 [Streptomyces sp. NBC_01283]